MENVLDQTTEWWAVGKSEKKLFPIEEFSLNTNAP